MRVMCAKSLQSCPTLCNPMDCSLPGPSVHGILQERILEWISELLCPPSVLLPEKSHGWKSLRLQSMGSQRVGHDWATSPSPSPPGNLGRVKVQRRGSQPLRWRWQGSGQDQKESWKYLLPRMTEKRATCMYTVNCFMWVRNFLKGIRKKKKMEKEKINIFSPLGFLPEFI